MSECEIKERTKKMEFSNFGWSMNRLLLLVGLVLISSAMTRSSPSAKDPGSHGKGTRIRKCCPFSQYFNAARGKCEAYPASWSSLGSSSDLPLSGKSDAVGGGTWSWTPPPKFWQLYSNDAPVLRFERDHTGFPRCSTGNEKDLDTTVVTVPERESENTGNSTWNYDPENETTHFFFKAGSEMLFEGRPDLLSVKTHHKPEHFCADLTDAELVLRVCRCSETQPCIRKCCPEGHHITFPDADPDSNSTVHYLCTEDAVVGESELPLHSTSGKQLSKTERQELNPRYIVNRVSCHPDFTIISSGWTAEGDDMVADLQHSFIIPTNGKPHIYDPIRAKWMEHKSRLDHCFDLFQGDSSLETCPGEKEVFLSCEEVVDEEEGNTGFFTFYAIAFVFSTIALLVTALVVFLLLETKNIHSWSRLAYVLSHFTFFFFMGLALARAVSPYGHVQSCEAVAVIIHFTGLMTACWLSIINFDLWWTFKVLKPRRGDKLDYVRFVCYSIFAIGLPLFIVSIGLGIQNQTKPFYCRAETMERSISPGYAQGDDCFVSRDAKPYYWFIPLCVLLVSNLIFFLTTTRRMMGLQRMTRRASAESTGGQTQSRQIFVKIFIVSGVTWWVEIIEWIFKGNSNAFAWYWLLLDMVHFVQAIAIFIIFVCKRDVIRSLQIKYPIITKVIPPVARLDRSGTQGSMSTTDANSKSFRVNYKLDGRKASTASSASSAVSTTPNDGSNKLKRLESIEMSTSPTTNPPPPSKDLAVSAKRVQIHEPSSPYFERRDTGNNECEMVDVDLNSDVTNTIT